MAPKKSTPKARTPKKSTEPQAKKKAAPAAKPTARKSAPSKATPKRPAAKRPPAKKGSAKSAAKKAPARKRSSTREVVSGVQFSRSWPPVAEPAPTAKPGRPRLLDDDEAIGALILHTSRGVAQDTAAVLAGSSARSVARLKAQAREVARLVAREKRRAATKGRKPVMPEPGTDEWRLWQFWQALREARAFAKADAEMTLKAHTRRSWRASLEWLARRYPKQWSRKLVVPEMEPDSIPDLNVLHGAAPYEATATDAALPGEPTGEPRAGAVPFDGMEDDEQ